MAASSSRPPALAMAPSLDGASAALHESVHKGNPGGVTRALRRGADVDSLNPGSGETALMLAGRLCDPKIVGLLLKAGASVSATSVENYTALHTAGLGGNAAIVGALLRAGASVSSRTKYGDTPFISAALRGHRGCAELLLAAGAEIDAADQNGRTGLMWAATHGRTEMVASLLAAGAKHGLRDDKGAQALHNATEHDQLGCMAALLRGGADPSAARSSGSGSGDTSLHMAVRRQRFNAARLLLRAGAHAHVSDKHGFTPLLCAASDGYTRMMAEILGFVQRRDDGEDVGGVGGGAPTLSAGDTTTALAASQRRLPQRQQQVGDWSVGPLMRRALSARNHDGWTALHMAAMVYDLGSVKLLLSYGALETEEDRAFHTAFQYPDRCVAGWPLPVKVNDKDVVPDPLRARLIVHSLERGPAYRARSWMLPAAADAPGEGTVRASGKQKPKKRFSVRVLRVSDLRRNKIFARAFGRYAELPSSRRPES